MKDRIKMGAHRELENSVHHLQVRYDCDGDGVHLSHHGYNVIETYHQ